MPPNNKFHLNSKRNILNCFNFYDISNQPILSRIRLCCYLIGITGSCYSKYYRLTVLRFVHEKNPTVRFETAGSCYLIWITAESGPSHGIMLSLINGI